MGLGDTIKTTTLAAAITLALVLQGTAQGQPPMRIHTKTKAQELELTPAKVSLSGGKVKQRATDATVDISANGIPDHAVGQFPIRGNPNRIQAQKYRLSTDARQLPDVARALGGAGLSGIAVNGVPFDPGVAEFRKGNPRSGWQYEALARAVPLGLDQNHAHVQLNGAYHYLGLPVGLMQQLGWSAQKPSQLIGYADDGFPIYAIIATVDGTLREMTSSYQLKFGNRPGGRLPGGRYDGAL